MAAGGAAAVPCIPLDNPGYGDQGDQRRTARGARNLASARA